MHSKTKIITGLIVVALVILGAYFLMPKKSAENIIDDSKVQYKNTEYGFSFALPDSWKNFSVVESQWSGDRVGANGQLIMGSDHGPMISIRHPEWTSSNPRQDIPIMIFTTAQWNNMQGTDGFHIGAAPINPSEIGRNSKYVFGIPARYNFSYSIGFEEVDQLIFHSDSFQAF